MIASAAELNGPVLPSSEMFREDPLVRDLRPQFLGSPSRAEEMEKTKVGWKNP